MKRSPDAIIDGHIADIASICSYPKNFQSQIWNKHKQASEFNSYNEGECHTICLYFHERAMFSEKKVFDGVFFAKRRATISGFSLRRIICVFKNGDYIEYNI